MLRIASGNEVGKRSRRVCWPKEVTACPPPEEVSNVSCCKKFISQLSAFIRQVKKMQDYRTPPVYAPPYDSSYAYRPPDYYNYPPPSYQVIQQTSAYPTYPQHS